MKIYTMFNKTRTIHTPMAYTFLYMKRGTVSIIPFYYKHWSSVPHHQNPDNYFLISLNVATLQIITSDSHNQMDQ